MKIKSIINQKDRIYKILFCIRYLEERNKKNQILKNHKFNILSDYFYKNIVFNIKEFNTNLKELKNIIKKYDLKIYDIIKNIE